MNPTHLPIVMVGETDHLDPELQAMLLAKYSRSYGSILSKIPTTPEEAAKAKAAFKKTYNGDSLAKHYGHKSVGQLGHTTIFFEGVSMLAAVAIEVCELFNGQESSTRYIDYTNQPAINFGDADITHWQEVWRLLYRSALERTMADLMVQYPRAKDVNEAKYNNTIKARAFDICGGMLPAGFTTCVGFTGSFDVLNDHIAWMFSHPLAEVRDIGALAAEAMMEKYPEAAFSMDKLVARSNFMLYDGAYSDSHIETYYYRRGSFEHDSIYSLDSTKRSVALRKQTPTYALTSLLGKRYPVVDDPTHAGRVSDLTLECQYWDKSSLATRDVVLEKLENRLCSFGAQTRNKYQSFPRMISNAIRFRANSVMDFRSYRDIHRHRNGYRPLPLLTMELGPHQYYLDNLNEELHQQFQSLFLKQQEAFRQARMETRSKEEANQLAVLQQYAIPMAAQVPYYYECDLNQVVYMTELRTDKTVHQTARIELMAAHDQLKHIFPRLQVHADLSASNFTLKRGEQTFAAAA
jgi:hypothetical protein